MRPRAPTIAIVVALSGACATPPPSSGPAAALTAREKVQKTEPLAFEAERQLNLAEKSLANLDPDAAEAQLETAQRSLRDPKLDIYPEADLLRSRHTELVGQVPSVRQEVARRKLAADVAAAKEKIEAAKGDLASFMAEVVRKDPGEATFKRADGALQALRESLDEAGPLESRDADYGKFAIAARKILEGQRQTLEKRKIAVAVDGAKHEIDGGMSVLGAALQQIRGRDIATSDIERARGAAEQVDSALKRSDEVADKDVGFAKYVAGARQKLAAARKTIDDRHHRLNVDTQRAKVESSRKIMADALGRLSAKDVGPSAFEEAETSVKGFRGTIDEGKDLEDKDRAYATYAGGMKKQHDAALNRIAARRLEVQVLTARAEISTRRELLGEALRRILAPGPSEADFNATIEAVSAVEKAVDSASELRGKDRKFAGYAVEVEKSLIPARATIGRRKLEVEIAAQRDKLNAALDTLAGSIKGMNAPTDFEAADGAVNGVERTLDEGEKYLGKDAKYGKLVTDARKRVAAARQQIRTRRDEVAMAEQKAKVQVQRDRLAELLTALAGFSASDEQFKAAREAVDETNKALDEGDELERRLRAYAAYATSVRKALADARKKIELRQVAVDVRNRRLLIEQAVGTAKLRVTDLEKPESSSEELKGASDALVSAREEITAGAALEKRDGQYGKFANASRKQLSALQRALDEAAPGVRFREGPVAALREARSAMSAADGLQDEEQRAAYSSTLEQLQSCQSDAKDMISEHKKLARQSFVAGRKNVKGSDVAKQCAAEAKTAKKKLAAVAQRLAFYEGPAKHFTNGHNLLTRAEASMSDNARGESLNGAIRAFEECVGEGRILEHKYPGLKKKSYDVDGRQVTVPMLVKACQVGAERARTMLKVPKG